MHPSWRDLVIDELGADAGARRAFLEHCSLDGLLLALSQAGGRSGARSLPLLVDDADWDAAAERIHELVPELDDDERLRLLSNLEAALDGTDDHAHAELLALVTTALERMAAGWSHSTALPDAGLLRKWLDLAALVPDPPTGLDIPRLWQLVVPPAVTPATAREAEAFVRWLRLAATLKARTPDVLDELGFPDAYLAQLHALVVIALHDEYTALSGTLRAAMTEALGLLASLVPEFAGRAGLVAAHLRWQERLAAGEPEPEPTIVRYAVPPAPSIVRRILADLG